MTAAWDWIKAQLIDLVLIVLFLLGFSSLIKGGRVAGLLVASAAIAVWLGAVLVAQMKVVEVGREDERLRVVSGLSVNSAGPGAPMCRGVAREVRSSSVPVLPSDSRASASGPGLSRVAAPPPPGGVAGPFNPRASLSAKAADARLSVAEDGQDERAARERA